MVINSQRPLIMWPLGDFKASRCFKKVLEGVPQETVELMRLDSQWIKGLL